jgi:hypothetical protein
MRHPTLNALVSLPDAHFIIGNATGKRTGTGPKSTVLLGDLDVPAGVFGNESATGEKFAP